MLVKVLNVVFPIIACVIWFLCGYFNGKKKVYKEWSDWLDRMSEIQKGWKNEKDNHR